ncbi:hypothetical protein QBC47DRAFT_402658 [Echria macrotheca]|uniref:Uncharacterized protein n=1 Tax=Echria macrotheca TaxID=438768 RepID=A0AAJ0BDJ8_9PEZI|nr:hypothetical protein QBC47DRAFT_402658 [Echria macrotheca]
MQFKSIIAVLAASLSLAMADEDITTTSTQTLTKTLTITECNPSYTACPGWKTNSSVSAAPTGWPSKNSTGWAYPTGTKPSTIETVPVVVVPTISKTAPTAPVATGAAGSLFVQSGLMLGLLGAGVALVA